MARVPLPDASEIVAEAPHLFDDLDLDDLHAARAMGNAPHALAGLFEYMAGLYTSLPAELRELAILATARVHDSEYEWHQHVEVAVEAGLSAETVRLIGGENWADLTGVTAAVCDFVRAQCEGEVTDEHVEAVNEYYTTEETVALSMLVGHYTGVAGVIDSMALPLEDEEFIGWTPAL
ncbi:carboxymuconolactone decarboxylase family protein [Halonotius terrestris]|uniref:Carboxymuconolactone decarboxylase family protein n=1 Tax=Halonotius terrestris TaxID=2487750 RepID=A0A8J8TAR7_9EURY|nr:carboxymuconolactone decarboxylase family protein [Halonotius terrestris]TQQ79284.1 carboxymuconolactone decarboxylase family protein [Halonotius terrestris]